MASLVREALLASGRSAVHLEMRDSYSVAEEADDFAEWKAGRWDSDRDAEKRRGWLDLVAETVGRGVVMRRARIISLPPSQYMRFEHAGTYLNVAAGEEVRWLPRMRAGDIALPGVDFWCFDDEVVIFNHFTGDGEWADPAMERIIDQTVVKLCSDAFASVWERGIPHANFAI